MIRNTVAFVIEDFFSINENAILSTCDTDDKDASVRYRLFRKWYNLLEDGTLIRKEQRVSTGEGETWALLYFKKDSIIRSLIEKYFDDYIEMMNELNQEML